MRKLPATLVLVTLAFFIIVFPTASTAAPVTSQAQTALVHLFWQILKFCYHNWTVIRILACFILVGIIIAVSNADPYQARARHHA